MSVAEVLVTQRPSAKRMKDDVREGIDARVRSGAYASEDDVIRAGLAALEREEQALAAEMRRRIEESLAEPGDDIPADRVIATRPFSRRDMS